MVGFLIMDEHKLKCCMGFIVGSAVLQVGVYVGAEHNCLLPNIHDTRMKSNIECKLLTTLLEMSLVFHLSFHFTDCTWAHTLKSQRLKKHLLFNW